MKQSRRDFVVSAAAASAFFGLSKPILMPAYAQDAAVKLKPFHKFKIGDIEVTTVSDGMWLKDHDPGFIKNASVDDTKAALKAAGIDDAKVPIPFTVTFAKVKDKMIMFDAGTGAQMAPTAGTLLPNMTAAGIDPKSITHVLVTHFHPDHIFGLMAKDTNAQTMPQAEIVVPAAEYAFWTDPGLIPKLPEARQGLAKRIQATFPTWKNIRQIKDADEILPGVVAISAPGHTPGHTVYQVGSGKDQLMVLADITNIPALFARHPEWHASFDSDGALAEQNRRKMFDRVVADKTMMTGYHYGMPGAGTIEKDGAGYVFKPAA